MSLTIGKMQPNSSSIKRGDCDQKKVSIGKKNATNRHKRQRRRSSNTGVSSESCDYEVIYDNYDAASLMKLKKEVNMDDFQYLDGPHPYGVLPSGNRWFTTTNATSNDNHMSTAQSRSFSGMLYNYKNTIDDDVVDSAHECWHTILSYLSPYDLCQLAQCDKFGYVTSHQPELWRDLVLCRLNINTSHEKKQENKANQKTSTDSITTCGPTWKDTYFKLFLEKSNNNKSKVKNHVPMKVSDVYSDYYYRLHKCRSFSIPEQWRCTDNAHGDVQTKTDVQSQSCARTSAVDRINAWEMNSTRFIQQYERRNLPVVIANGASTWKAFQDWKNPSYLLSLQQQEQSLQKNTNSNPIVQTNVTGFDNEVDVMHKTNTLENMPELQEEGIHSYRATSGMAPLPANFTLRAYYEYCDQKSHPQPTQHSKSSAPLFEEGPLYLFDRNALKPHSRLWMDYYPDMQRTCPYWDPSNVRDYDEDEAKIKNNDTNSLSSISAEASVGHDLFQFLGENERPDHTWLIAGPQRSGSVFHIDPNATHAWNACIVGRKRWILYPPGSTDPPPGVYPSQNGDEVLVPLSIGEWIFQYWNEHLQRKQRPQPYCPLECTTGPGDIMFVPHGWWHMVINLDPGINIAITHNYVSYSNLSNVLRFLRTKQNQISGCRDRSNSIKPDQLYDAFVQKLHEVCPKQLNIAKNVPFWTCAAWNDDFSTVEDECSVVVHPTMRTKRRMNGTNARRMERRNKKQHRTSNHLFDDEIPDQNKKSNNCYEHDIASTHSQKSSTLVTTKSISIMDQAKIGGVGRNIKPFSFSFL